MVVMQSMAMDTGGEASLVTAAAGEPQNNGNNIGGGDPQATERCAVCHTDPMSPYFYQKHLASARHRKSLNNLENTRKLASMTDEFVAVDLPSSRGYQCKLCAIFLTSADIALTHSRGAKHQYRRHNRPPHEPAAAASAVVSVPLLAGNFSASARGSFPNQQQPATNQPTASGKGAIAGISGSAYKTASSISAIPSLVNQAVTRPDGAPAESGGDGGGTALFHCAVCSSSMNSHTQLMAHVRGGRHRHNLQSLVDEGKAPPDSLAAVEALCAGGVGADLGATLPFGLSQAAAGGGLFVCRQCNVATNSAVQLQQHLHSLRHSTGTRANNTAHRAAGAGATRKPYQRHATSGTYHNYAGTAVMTRSVMTASGVSAGGHSTTHQSAPAATAAGGGNGGGMVTPYAAAAGYGQGAAGHYSMAVAAAASSHEYSAQQYLAGGDMYAARNYYLAKPPPPPPLQKSYMKGHFM